jgi:Uma2 family endonuclease
MLRRPSVPQTDPPLPPRLTLPTMYDLPSEDPEEPGLPDEFHDLQPQLLSRSLRLVDYAVDRVFTGSDLNLYYDLRHPLWYKRPDWFLVLDVPRLYEETELRSSYVVWQEGVNPFVVVELLSPGTEKEDLGRYAEDQLELEKATAAIATSLTDKQDSEFEPGNGQTTQEKPPKKWDVYERILRVPHYIVFSRYTNRLRAFQLVGGHYQERTIDAADPKVWIPELKLGLKLWQGEFEGITRQWLRWVDAQDNWLLTDTEQERQAKEQERQAKEQERQAKEQERQAKEQALQKAEQAEAQLRQVAANLLRTGMTIDQVAELMGLSTEQVKQLQIEHDL